MADVYQFVMLVPDDVRWLGKRADAAGLNQRRLPAGMESELDVEGWSMAHVIIPHHKRTRMPGDPFYDVDHHRLRLLLKLRGEVMPMELLLDVLASDWWLLPPYNEDARRHPGAYSTMMRMAMTRAGIIALGEPVDSGSGSGVPASPCSCGFQPESWDDLDQHAQQCARKL